MFSQVTMVKFLAIEPLTVPGTTHGPTYHPTGSSLPDELRAIQSLSSIPAHFLGPLLESTASFGCQMGLEVQETNWKYAHERPRDETPKVGRKILQTKMRR